MTGWLAVLTVGHVLPFPELCAIWAHQIGSSLLFSAQSYAGMCKRLNSPEAAEYDNPFRASMPLLTIGQSLGWDNEAKVSRGRIPLA